MSRISFSFILAFLFLALLYGCKPDPVAQAAEVKEKQDEAIQSLEQSFEKLKAANANVVDFRFLKEGLPEKVLGMDRVDHQGQKAGIGDMQFSMAEATYSQGDKTVTIKMIDTGGFGAALAGLAAWSQVEVDKESADGYERTTMIGEKKAIEKYNRVTKEGEISMINAERFIVSITGRQISEDDLRQVVSQIRIKT